jgi:hypothetical protein
MVFLFLPSFTLLTDILNEGLLGDLWYYGVTEDEWYYPEDDKVEINRPGVYPEQPNGGRTNSVYYPGARLDMSLSVINSFFLHTIIQSN